MYRFFIFPVLFLFFSCKNQVENTSKKGLHLFYVIIDKSSNSFSTQGGEEENYIKIDANYVDQFINKLNQVINLNKAKNDIVLFFNYIDKDARGNKELFLKLKAYELIDTIYKPKAGQVVSTRHKFEEKIKQQKQVYISALQEFEKQKSNLFLNLIPMLEKSKYTKGSDCSGTLLVADKKLQSYFIDTTKYVLKNKLIITFSDLVNFPRNNKAITLSNKVLRPGYTSNVPYIKDEQLINLTTEEEFYDYLQTILNL